VEILSGVFEGRTTGAPISLIVFNTNQQSKDYDEIAKLWRPGHADYTYDMKYGFRDYRGGGRSSARETTARVAAGAVAKKILGMLNVDIMAYTKSIGPVTIDMANFDRDQIYKNFLTMPDASKVAEAEAYLTKVKDAGDSAGGVIECVVNNCPVGLGEPVFDKLDGLLAKAIMSLGAMKGIEFGSGSDVTTRTGSENNDFFTYVDGELSKETNHAGGTLGGLSDGSQIFMRVYVKPTPSVHTTQRTVTKDGRNVDVNIEGRHDPIIVPRAVIVIEAMVALTLVDMLLANMSSKLSNVMKVYQT
ncbi:MAG: chorismate synthase, partial [Vallitaleaceae bacterium]|nr:chorismate synthase [Vallitaleaceae bacterium]